MKTEDLLIKAIENGIRAVHLGTWPNDTKAPYALSKLKDSNYGMYLDLLDKFMKAVKDYNTKHEVKCDVFSQPDSHNYIAVEDSNSD